MRRRDFVKSSLFALSPWWQKALGQMLGSTAPPQNNQVKRVLAMFKCHFDAGFIDTQKAVIEHYFRRYFPQAVTIAEHSREVGNARYVWSTGSWLLYEYLEQASPDERRSMEQAIANNDIAWHALPFSWQTEMMDRSMISASIALSHSLDRRFGRTTTGAKMTDVPGHTRALVAALSAEGIRFLDIGVNDASTPADLPPLFLWQDATGGSLVVMYHHGYGGILPVPGSDLAIAIVVRDDNSGPHPVAEIQKIYSDLHGRFPKAQIVAGGLTEIANAVEPFRKNLPTITQEIGDSWIHGIASDPLKVARYREVARLRQSWIGQGKFQAGDATDVALLRRVLLEIEHTWGTDTKTWLDFDHYKPRDLAEMLDSKNYQVVEFSWSEKRQDLFDGLAALPPALRREAETRMGELTPRKPELPNGVAHPIDQALETSHFVLLLDPRTGAIQRLRNKQSGYEWASPEHPLALFTYQTLSPADYSRFFRSYIQSTADWAQKDFGKPNIDRFGAESREWQAKVLRVEIAEDQQYHRLLETLEINDPDAFNSGVAAFPKRLYLELSLAKNDALIHIDFSWFEKPATRMPEALWLTFNPQVPDQRGWKLAKSGQPVSPFEVVSGGSRHMHAVSTGFSYESGQQSFTVETVDAPLVALGERSPLNFSRAQPDLSSGIHCNLFNNAWGTNYIMWFAEDMRFRFRLRA